MIKPPSSLLLTTALTVTTLFAMPCFNANAKTNQPTALSAQTTLKSKTEQNNEPFRLYISLDDEKEGEEKEKILLIKNHQVIAGNSMKAKESIKNGWKNIHPIHCEENEKDCSWYAIVTDSKGKEGYINADGKWIVKPIYDTARAFSNEGIARVQQGGRWHYINRKGDNVFNKNFAYASPFSSEGIAQVQQGGRSHYINRNGDTLFNKSFANATSFFQGYAVVVDEQNDKGAVVDMNYSSLPLQDYYYIDVKGNKVFDNILSNGADNFYNELNQSGNVLAYAGQFDDNGLAVIIIARKISSYLISENTTKKESMISEVRYGYINKKGEVAIKPKFLEIRAFNKFGITKVSEIDEEYFFINTQGKPINDKKYYRIDEFSENGIAYAKSKDGKFEGFVNTKGKQLFESRYSGKDINGRILIDTQFYDNTGKKVGPYLTWAKPFYDEEVTLVRDDGKWGIFHRDGKFQPFASNIIAPVTVEKDISGFVDGLVAMIDDKQEIVYFDRQGKEQYRFGKGQPKKGKKGQMVLTNNTGNVLWQSDINNQAIRNLFTPAKADFINSELYKKSGSIIPVVEAMINSKPKPYYIPSPLSGEGDESPYKVTEDAIENEEVKTGAVDIVVEEYLDEYTYGAYDFLPNVRNGVSDLYKGIKAELIQHYGEPIKPEEDYWKPLQWKMADKTLSLSSQTDSGDGDYYTQIVLELNETKEQPKSNK